MRPSLSHESMMRDIVSLICLANLALATPVAWSSFPNNTDRLNIISRDEWGARQPKARVSLGISPAPFVVIHHGGIREYCYNQQKCSAIVRSYQDLHIDDRGWYDVGYSFVIGEDGNAYEGRGWDYSGAHAPPYNNQSIGICVIGDFSDFLPNKLALITLNSLIEYGVAIGKIREDYRVLGHRQARNTLCPGNEFFKYVKLHPRWISKPAPYSTIPTTTEAVILNDNTVQTDGNT